MPSKPTQALLEASGCMSSSPDSCRPLINEPPPVKGLKIRILTIIPIKGRGFINPGSTDYRP